MKVEVFGLPRVEGEARLELKWDGGFIGDARISLTSSRGIEKVLLGRPYMDALVITPRVCGICGHAHLMASVRAIEEAIGISPTEKGELVRVITQSLEVLQNHIKWFYLFLMPDFTLLEEELKDLYGPLRGARWLEAVRLASKITRGIALFSGQWPHSSYAVPGGITSEPTLREILTLKGIMSEVGEFFLNRMVGMEREEFVSWISRSSWSGISGDLGVFLELSQRAGLLGTGRAYDQLLSGGGLYNPCGYYIKRPVHGRLKLSHMQELEPPTYSKAKPMRYKGLPFETGPLSRQMLAGNYIIKAMHRELRDAFAVRVMARALEIWDVLGLVERSLERLKDVLSQKSTSLKRPPARISGVGNGIVEAARGTLIHRLNIKDGLIRDYQIITPSQWNLGPRCERFLGVAERAIVGLREPLHARMVLRSFDLCSVCTTQ